MIGCSSPESASYGRGAPVLLTFWCPGLVSSPSSPDTTAKARMSQFLGPHLQLRLAGHVHDAAPLHHDCFVLVPNSDVRTVVRQSIGMARLYSYRRPQHDGVNHETLTLPKEDRQTSLKLTSGYMA
ncbi:hypothetical protein CC79DRAFT_1334765 [Sarocladium strictum]